MLPKHQEGQPRNKIDSSEVQQEPRNQEKKLSDKTIQGDSKSNVTKEEDQEIEKRIVDTQPANIDKRELYADETSTKKDKDTCDETNLIVDSNHEGESQKQEGITDVKDT